MTPLNGMLKDSLGFSSSDRRFLFSAYSVANVFLFMVLISGLLVGRLGTAFGVVDLIPKVGLMLFPWIARKVEDAFTTVEKVAGEETMHIDYTTTLMLFSGLASVSLVAAVFLKRVDGRRTEGLSIERMITI